MFVWTRPVMVSWQHRSIENIENVWQTATTVSIYKHSVRITEYPSKLLHIGYAENLLVYGLYQLLSTRFLTKP